MRDANDMQGPGETDRGGTPRSCQSDQALLLSPAPAAASRCPTQQLSHAFTVAPPGPLRAPVHPPIPSQLISIVQGRCLAIRLPTVESQLPLILRLGCKKNDP